MQEIACQWRGHTSQALIETFERHGELDAQSIGSAALDAHGSFAAIRRGADGSIIILTDHSGSIPVYYGRKAGSLSVGWSSNTVAKELGSPAIDSISAADFIANEAVCYPFTLFENVFVAPPGAVSVVTSSGINSTAYFRPCEASDFGSVEEWGERLRCVMRTAISSGLDGCRTAKVLYSGGEDARSVVSLLPTELDCELITIAETDNREVRIARRAARLQGRPFSYHKRPHGFYRKQIDERSHLVGGAFDIRHTHIFGPTAAGLSDVDALLGGYMSDGLFKSLWLRNVRRRKFGPETLIGSRAEHRTHIGWKPDSSWMDPDVINEVARRHLNYFRTLQEFRPETAENWMFLWPLGAHERAMAHYLSLLAIGPRVIEPFLTGQVYRLASAMPERFRLDRRVFRAAFSRPLGVAAWLPTSSGKVPALNGYSGHYSRSAINRRRRVSDRLRSCWYAANGRAVPEQGPWSDGSGKSSLKPYEVLSKERQELLGKLLSEISVVSLQRSLSTLNSTDTLSFARSVRICQIGCQIP